jgi:hypothetical protein
MDIADISFHLSLLTSRASDVKAAHHYYVACMVTIVMDQLRPVARVKWDRMAIVSYRSSVRSWFQKTTSLTKIIEII